MDICWACCNINTETSTHVPTKFRFSVALLYLNQCPLNSILSQFLSLFVQFNQSLQNVNCSQFRFLRRGGLWTDEQKAQLDNSLGMFLEAGIKKPNMDANVDHTSLDKFWICLMNHQKSNSCFCHLYQIYQIWLPCNV